MTSTSSAYSYDTSSSESSKETATTSTSQVALDGLNDSFTSQQNSLGGDHESCCRSFCFGPTIQLNRRGDCFIAIDTVQPPLERAAANGGNGDIFTPLLDRVFSTRRSLSPIQSLAGQSSANTLHKRADVSAGFFTLSTLEAIHCISQDNSENSSPSVESRSKDLPSYKTPARCRINSEAFLRTIGEVTCEKGVNSDDDVSQIEDEDFDTLLLNVEQQSSVFNSPGRKKLCFDGNQETGNELYAEDSSEETSPPLFPEFGKAIESFQALVLSPMKSLHREEDRSSTPKLLKHLQSDGKIHGPTSTVPPRKDLYLRKSTTYIKALRRSGIVGKILIQGWVAFRNTESWREVSRCTTRSDFRYIVLLDGVPTFYIFNSKPKQRRGEPAPNLLDDCIAIDLNKENIDVGVSLASSQLGHEIYLLDTEKNKLLCSMLPVAMRDYVFLNKHRSRLAKSDVLQSIFQDHQKIPSYYLAGTDQSDAARHILFVLSSVITSTK